MEYDVRKSPCENILSEQPRIRGTVSPQQSDSIINLGQFTGGTKNLPRDPYNAQLSPLPSRYNSIHDVPKTRPVKWGWDHDASGKIELTMTLAGMGLMTSGWGAIPGTVLLGAGTVVGVADALMYYVEGKPYDGTMMMALQMIPGGELIRGLSKYTKHADNLPEFQRILKKMSESKTLTDLEEKVYIELSGAFRKLLPELGPKLSKYTFQFLRATLKRLPLLGVMKFLRNLFKGLKFIGKFVIKISRIVITFDQLWILLSTPEMAKARDKSELKKLLQYLVYDRFTEDEINNMWEAKEMLYNPDGTINSQGQDSIKNGVINAIPMMATGASPDVKQAIMSLDDVLIQPEPGNTIVKKTTPEPTPVTIDSILSGKQTIRKGQKGQVVGEIQNMLLYLGYDLGETGKAGIDRDFGDTTKKAVEKFQKDNKLKDTSGVVGKETLTLLIKQFEDAG
jgi:hypothetical protein